MPKDRNPKEHLVGEGRFDESFTYWDTASQSELLKDRGYTQLADGTWVP